VGPTAILARVRQAAREGRTPVLLSLPEVLGDPDAIRMPHIFEAAARDEFAVQLVLDEVGRYLGIGIRIECFQSQPVVLGGSTSWLTYHATGQREAAGRPARHARMRKPASAFVRRLSRRRR
jgi:predicted NBD/HSP70 family sugar kinase